jgi:hypothetical protein
MSPIANAVKLAAMNVKSQTHKIDGKTYLFKTKLTAEEAEKRVAEKKAAAPAPKAETKKDYWLKKLDEISEALTKGKVFKGFQYEDKSKSHTFYRVVDEARHSKYSQNYVMFEWNEKNITPANKDETDKSITELKDTVNGKLFHLELQTARPWERGGDWDTHMLLYYDENINANTLMNAEVVDVMRKIIKNKL